MKICIAGKNSIAINALQYLLSINIEKNNIIACINETDNGLNDWQPSFKHFCNSNGIPIFHLQQLFEIENLIFISLEFDKLIKPKLFKSKYLYNIHFSLLPAYKGMYTSIMPILYNENKTGVTLHKIDEGIDTGEIIDQLFFEINDIVNSFEIYMSYLQYSFTLFQKNIQNILENNITSKKQSAVGSSYYSKKTIDFKNIIINFSQTANQVHNQIRGFAFRPYQLPIVNNYKIAFSKILETKSSFKPGILIYEDEFKIQYSTIDYDIELYKDKLDEILISAQSGNIDYLNKLYKLSYNLNEKNDKGWNVFIVAVYNNQIDLCEWLIANSFNLNVINNNGTTLAMYAMTMASNTNSTKILELLIQNGIDLNVQDFNRKNIFDYARVYNNSKVITLLNKYKND